MRGSQMTVLQELAKLSDTLINPYMERWKKKGGKIIGYHGIYVPEEVIHAAGMLPYRLRATGSTSSELGDVYASSTTCTYCRHCLDQAMRGEYKFLDGFVSFHGCDHLSRSFDAWRYGKVPTPYSPFYLRFLDIPFKINARSVKWMQVQVERFKRSLEEHFGLTITDDALRQSIKTYNEQRKLLRSLYEMRKKEKPPVTGAEVLALVIASTSMPVEEFNEQFKKVLAEVNGRDGFKDYRARLLLVGGTLEDPEYIRTIEELGGLVVIDALCVGIRHFWDLVDEDSEPTAALAKRYLDRSISCPRMVDYERRLKFVSDLAREFNTDGIIVQRMKMCDNWGCDSAMIKQQARKEGMPCLILEREYLMSGVGQMRTRVQAFLETIRR